MLRPLLLILLQLFIVGLCFSQQQADQIISLEKCIELAIANNPGLKGNDLAQNTASINLRQSKFDQLPTVNFNYNLGRASGRSIDPFSNDVVTEGLNFSNAGLSLDADVFNGFRIKHTIRQNEQIIAATGMQKKALEELLILDVTLAYLQVLNDKDLLRLSRESLNITEAQFVRLAVLYEKEVGNPAEYYDFKAEVNSNRMSILNLENQLSNSLIVLATLMNADIKELGDIEAFPQANSLDIYGHSAQEVYQDALQNLSQIKSRELERDAAQTGILIEKSAIFPSLSLFGRLNTNYSSAAQSFTEIGSSITSTDNFVQINNEEIPVLKNSTSFDSAPISYFTQFQNNLNSAFGLAIRVPIFNGLTSKNNMALQKIAVKEKELEIQTTKLELRQSIETAHLNMTTSFKRYQILSDQIVDLRESFRVNEVRFNKGISNSVDYLTSKGNLENALVNQSMTAHEYELRKWVMEYYRGKN